MRWTSHLLMAVSCQKLLGQDPSLIVILDQSMCIRVFRRLHMKMKAKRTCYPCWSCWHLTSYQIRRKSKALPLLSGYVEFLSNASGEFYSCLGILLHQMIQRCASTFFGCNLSQRSYISNELCFHLFNSISMTIIKMGTHLLLWG